MSHDSLVAMLLTLLTISEALGGIKSISANSIYQVIMSLVKALYNAVTGNGEPKTS
jgi:hypothetical protein